ncbi:uncharacterized protein LOC124597889 [Schistocerca americana]|uniref:uncharacterized protein LOC124597889 n=1 Tax=Schistocerca americana TaxID=7009 RepID=UPI001F4F7E06|nr:uncharacterized protein LOC124597889 [Schistocerca americana]
MEILSKDEEVVYKDRDDVLQRWEEYIKELYDTNSKPETLELESHNSVGDEEKGPTIIMEEVKSAIAAMKNGKAEERPTVREAVMSPLALGVPLTVVNVLGLLVNGYILLVVLITKQAHTANSLLLLHLGAVDALLCAVFLLFPAPGLLLRSGTGAAWLGAGSAACATHGFLITLLHPVALWTVCGLHCDRYCAIAAPLHYGALVSARRVAAGLAAAWAASLALALPPLFLAAPAYRYSAAQAGCAPDGGAALWYSAAYAVLALLLPTAVILACNVKVLMIARYHRHRIASAIFEVALSAQVTIMHQRNPLAGAATPAAVAARSLYRGRNAVPTVLQLVAACILLYVPWHAAILWEAAAAAASASAAASAVTTAAPGAASAAPGAAAVAVRPPPPPLLALSAALLACAPSVNGVLYGVRSKLLRKTFQNYWRKQMSKSEMNQEIQARTPSACGSRRPSLTPLGLLTRPCAATLQRRLSEALLDPSQRTSPHARDRPRIQRIASELDWRPVGLAAGNHTTPQFSADLCIQGVQKLALQLKPGGLERGGRAHAASCNTLRVPDSEASPLTLQPVAAPAPTSAPTPRVTVRAAPAVSCGPANLFLQRVFGAGAAAGTGGADKEVSLKRAAAIQTVLSTPRRSPRILITRAFSEESDHSPPASAAAGDLGDGGAGVGLGRKYSTSTTSLLDRRWRLALDAKECIDSSSDDECDCSDASSGRLFFSLDCASGASTTPLVANNTTSSASNNSSGCGGVATNHVQLQQQAAGAPPPAPKRHQLQLQLHDHDQGGVGSWPTARRPAPASHSMVQLARSLNDVPSAPEFVL